MTYAATIVEIFLSSPSDVAAERSLIVRMADEWNQLRSRDTGCFISIITWEGVVAPATGDRVQQVVKDQIGLDYDIYLGLMWTRLGTPTGEADSGTVEEFDNALAELKNGKRIWVANLFKIGAVEFDKIDPDQISKVKEFKARVASEGGFYREFSDDHSLRTVMTMIFEKAAKLSPSDMQQDEVRTQKSSTAPVVAARPDKDIEIGVIEIGEQFSALSDAFVQDLQQLMEYEDRNNKTIVATTEELATATRYGRVNPETIKPIVHRASVSLKDLSTHIDSMMDGLEEKAKEMARLIELELIVRLDFGDPLEGYDATLKGLVSLNENIDAAIASFDELTTTTEQLPRMSTEMAKARNRLVKSRQRMTEMFKRLKVSIDNSLHFFHDQAGRIAIVDAIPVSSTATVSELKTVGRIRERKPRGRRS